MAKRMYTRVQNKHDIEANWNKANNFFPLIGEIIVYDIEKEGDELPEGRTELITYPRFKFGDGIHIPKDLPFVDEGTKLYTDLKLESLKQELLGSEELIDTYDTLSEIGAWIKNEGIDTTELTTAIAEEASKRDSKDQELSAAVTSEQETRIAGDAELEAAVEAERQARIAGDVQSNWNDNSASSLAHILNKPDISNGSGNKSIVIGEGEAIGDYSVAGGTNDKDLLGGLAGGLASWVADIDVSKAEGDMSLSFGAGTKSRTAGTLSIGVNSNAGCKCFYFTKVSGTTITLSKKQPSTLSPNATWDSNAQTLLSNWRAGDILTITNDKTYAMCSKIVSISNTSSAASIVVDALPFTSKASNAFVPNFNDFIIINHTRPEAGITQFGMGAMSIGMGNESQGLFSKAEGRDNSAFGNYSHAEGQDNKTGHCAHAEGRGNTASGNHSHSEGFCTESIGDSSHSEGTETKSVGDYSHAEGVTTTSTGKGSHSEGRNTNSTGNYSHSEGFNNISSGEYAHSEGYETEALGRTSHSEGAWSISKGVASHAEGRSTEAQANYSHTEGYGTVATATYQHVQGKFNALDTNGKSGNYAHVVGNGSVAEYDDSGNLTKAEVRSNAYTLDWNGNAWFSGNVTIGADKQELATKQYVLDQAQDLSGYATKEDVENTYLSISSAEANYLKNDALNNYVTKDELKGYATEDYVNSLVGDIESTLDSIIATQESLIGGGN